MDWNLPTVDSFDSWQVEELYRDYLRANERNRQRYVSAISPGKYRDQILQFLNPLHRERFEARLVELSVEPERYRRFVEAIRAAAA